MTSQPQQQKFVVSFDTNGGEPIESIKAIDGEVIGLPIPTKEGYLFSDWNNTYEPKALIDISSDVELEAAWDKAIIINLIDQSEQIKNTLLVRETTSK
jgi:hypothetical protein